MSHLNEGDLAWLPSSTALLDFVEEGVASSGVREWCYPKEPKHVLVLKELDDTYYIIAYGGRKWAVPKRELHRLKE